VLANATSTVAIWPGSLSSAWAYRVQILNRRHQALILALPSLLGGLIGSILLIYTPEKAFRVIVPYLIVLACTLLIFQARIGHWVARHMGYSVARVSAAHWIVQFLIAVYGGYFGAGIGILMLAGMAIFLPEDLQSANALKVFFGMLINGIAMFYFIFIGAADLRAAGVMALASLPGGYVGAHTAQRLSSALLRAVVVTFGLIVAAYLFRKG
jgi:hypothetical protein